MHLKHILFSLSETVEEPFFPPGMVKPDAVAESWTERIATFASMAFVTQPPEETRGRGGGSEESVRDVVGHVDLFVIVPVLTGEVVHAVDDTASVLRA